MLSADPTSCLGIEAGQLPEAFVHTGGLPARELTVKSNLKGMVEFANVFFTLPFQPQTVTHQTYRLTRTADRWADKAKDGKELKFLFPTCQSCLALQKYSHRGGERSRRVLI